MDKTSEGGRPVAARPRLSDHQVTVRSVTDFTPWYRRVEFDAEGLFEQYESMPAGYLLVNVPSLDGASSVQRAYSIDGVSADNFWLEFVLHSPAGPGSAWAAAAEPGMTVTVSEPAYNLAVPALSCALLIADPTALPGVRSLVDALSPQMRVLARIVDSHHDHDLVPLVTEGKADIDWLDEVTGQKLTELTAGIDPSDCFVWAAGERQLAKQVREFTRTTLPVPRSSQHIQTYWIAGR
ncbi:MAG: siderophore-interacting protein [Propionibacteriaceae bacterium]|jgi:ATP-binding cassette subfamily B protein IrtA|nr:siderophore-interacting protein [Propionibacteriaceae bacterium]